MNSKISLKYMLLLGIFAFVGVHIPIYSMNNDEAVKSELDRTRRAINIINELVAIPVARAREEGRAPVIDDALKNTLQKFHDNDPHIMALTQRALRVFPAPLEQLLLQEQSVPAGSGEQRKNMPPEISADEARRVVNAIEYHIEQRVEQDSLFGAGQLFVDQVYPLEQLVGELGHIHQNDPARMRIMGRMLLAYIRALDGHIRQAEAIGRNSSNVCA